MGNVIGKVCGDSEANLKATMSKATSEAAMLTGDADLSSLIEIHVSCKNLPNMDTMSKTDALVVLFVKEHSSLNSSDNRSPQWVKVGQTEVVTDNLNPKFFTALDLKYRFEVQQELKFEVYDVDDFNNVGDLRRHTLIGRVLTTGGEIGTNLGRAIELPISNTRAMLKIHAEEISKNRDGLEVKFSGANLDKKDFFGASDPFLTLSMCTEGSWVPVFKTEVVKNTLNPTWRTHEIPLQRLCNADHRRPILISCLDWNRNGSHDIIGTFETTVDRLTRMKRDQRVTLVNPKTGKNAGEIVVHKCKIIENYSFLDYVSGGCDIALHIAVDFTASNGHPNDIRSLHCIRSDTTNQYLSALQQVGDILGYYDSDQMIPIYGFGGKVNGCVSHCFPLNGQDDDPEVDGVQGCVDAYHNAIRNVQLSGPTMLSHVVNRVIGDATSQEVSQEHQEYHVLMILTDGVTHDMRDTIDAIVKASVKPMSIVIVGIGKADFTDMNILDADDDPLYNSRGVKMGRDIVQFCPFNDFKGNAEALAEEVLYEIPGQLVSFMKNNKIVPNKR